MTIPLPPQRRRLKSLIVPFFNRSHPILGDPASVVAPWRRVACVVLRFSYPFMILVAIVVTANHFILDAVAGAIVCGMRWHGNTVLLDLLPLEDYFLSPYGSTSQKGCGPRIL
jgi:hypothetical protein